MQLDKLADIWITEKTLSKHFDKDKVIENIEEIKNIEENTIYLRFLNGIHYEVYGTNKAIYEKIMNKIKFTDHYYKE